MSSIKIQGSVLVKRPIKEVFNYVSDFTNDKNWRDEVIDFKYTGDGEIGVGKQCKETTKVWGQKLESESEVTEYVPNEKVSIKSIKSGTPMVSTRKFHEMHNGTEIKYEVDLNVDNVFMLKMFRPIVEKKAQVNIQLYLDQLKKILEKGKHYN